jgi:hypothetical protein
MLTFIVTFNLYYFSILFAPKGYYKNININDTELARKNENVDDKLI